MISYLRNIMLTAVIILLIQSILPQNQYTQVNTLLRLLFLLSMLQILPKIIME